MKKTKGKYHHGVTRSFTEKETRSNLTEKLCVNSVKLRGKKKEMKFALQLETSNKQPGTKDSKQIT